MSDEQWRELADLLRKRSAGHERMAAALLGAVRVLARDVLMVANAPGDPLGPEIVEQARQRAERVLTDLGDDERAN